MVDIAVIWPGALGDSIMLLQCMPALINKHGLVHVYLNPSTKSQISFLFSQLELETFEFTNIEQVKAKGYKQVINAIGYPASSGYPYRPLKKHIVEYFADSLGVSVEGIPLRLSKPSKPAELCDSYVTIHTTPKWSPYKRWIDSRWTELVGRLSARGINVVQIGGAEDVEVASCHRYYLGNSLETNLAVQAYARLHIGVDSVWNHTTNIDWLEGGKVPGVILFGSTQATASGYKHNRNLYLGLSCQPCFREDPSISSVPIGICVNPVGQMSWYENRHACMAGISVDMVENQVMSQLDKSTSTEKPASPKIAVYAISKNEAKHVDRFMDSVKDADYVVVADTGSTDDTKAKLEDRGAKVYSIHVHPWRFDTARNTALSLVPADAEICIKLDLDEVMLPNWKEEILKVWVPGQTTRLSYRFINPDPPGYVASWIHSRHNYIWKWPIHELPQCTTQEVSAFTEAALTSHLPDRSKPRSSYLGMLETLAREEPTARAWFYLCRERMYCKKWAECIEAAEKFLAMPDARWDAERSSALRYAARSANNLHQNDKAIAFLLRACSETPHRREPWYDLAYLYWQTKNYAGCHFAATTALSITKKPNDFLYEPDAWGWQLYELAFLGSYYLGMVEKSSKYLDEAIKLNPNEPRLLDSKNWVKKVAEKLPFSIIALHDPEDPSSREKLSLLQSACGEVKVYDYDICDQKTLYNMDIHIVAGKKHLYADTVWKQLTNQKSACLVVALANWHRMCFRNMLQNGKLGSVVVVDWSETIKGFSSRRLFRESTLMHKANESDPTFYHVAANNEPDLREALQKLYDLQ